MVSKLKFLAAAVLLTAMPASAQSEGDVAADGNAPRIQADPMTFDFKDTLNEGPIEFTFTLTNAGEKTLRIENVRPSCGCTVADVSDKSIQPGGSATITGTLDLPGRSGPISKSLTVLSNDPERPALALNIKGNLIRKIYFEPSGLSFARIGVNDERTESIIVKTSLDDVEFEISEYSLIDTVDNQPPEFFKVEMNPVVEGKEYRFDVATVPPLPNRSIRGNLVIKTNIEGYEELTAYVGAAPMGDIVISPNTMILPQPRQGARPATRRMLLRPGTIEEFNVTAVEFPIEGIETKVTFKENIGYLIDIVDFVPTDEMDGKEIVIKTDIPTTPEVVVPIRIIRPQQVPRRAKPTQ